jgi:hypothetical protein
MAGGFFIHSGRLHAMARAASVRARIEASTGVDHRTEDAITAVVMAAVAAEAFINELGELVVGAQQGPMFAIAENRTLFELGDVLEDIEMARGSLMLKYQMTSKLLSGATLKKGENPMQDFITLVNLRNDFVHLKPRDNIGLAADGRLKVNPPRYISDLQRRGLAHRPANMDVMSWFDLLMTVELAEWACDTSKKMILKVLSFIPDHPLDPTALMKRIFRAEPRLPSPSSGVD